MSWMGKVRHEPAKALIEISLFSKIDTITECNGIIFMMAFFTSEITVNFSMFAFYL